ncbi:DUF3006 domain-containing protein [Patescibacteria group bacterium]
MDNNLKCVIDRIEGEQAVLCFDDGQKLNWPLEKLPSGAVEGSSLKLKIDQNGLSDEEEKTLLAKNILNEILDVKN